MLITNSNTENIQLIRQSAKDFAQTHIKPHLMDWDEQQYFPRPVFSALGDLGFMGVLVPEIYGGSGLAYPEYIAIIDEIAQVCGSIGLSVAAHNSLCTNHILEFGSQDQKSHYLPKLASGEWIGAWALTEPNTGSDAGRMQCIAEKDGNHFTGFKIDSWRI